MLEIQSSSKGEQKFFIFIRQKKFYIYFVLKKYRQVSAIFTDTTSRYHKNRPIPPILKYRYITRPYWGICNEVPYPRAHRNHSARLSIKLASFCLQAFVCPIFTNVFPGWFPFWSLTHITSMEKMLRSSCRVMTG